MKETSQALSPDLAGRQGGVPWLRLARFAWYPLAAVAFAIFFAALPGFFMMGSEAVIDPRFTANPSPWFRILLRVTIAIAVSASLVSLLLAVLLFKRRAHDRMALLTSIVLLAYGVIMAGPLEALEPFIPGIAAVTTTLVIPLFQPFLLLLFVVFPDGRFVPGWTKWPVTAVFLMIPLALFSTTILDLPSLDLTQPTTMIITGAGMLVFVAIASMILYAQVVRYRRVSTMLQRQQTKWVLYGVAIWFTVQLAASTPWLYTYSLPPGTPYPTWLAIITPLWVLSIMAIPLTLTVAVLRYRLFEIDFIINRSLLYGALTISVVAIYVLVVAAAGSLFQAQGNLVVALLATGVVAVLFQPLRDRLQRGVNRLVFGEQDDPIEALSRLGRRLETTVQPDNVLPTLVRTIARTLKLPYVAIHLPANDEDTVAAAHGQPVADVDRFELVYQGENVGQMVVGLRGPGSRFSATEMRLLRNIARQAGAAVHAVQLTADLQRSRQQLVTTREEERLRLRRDLHDGLGPALASVVWQADSARDLLHTEPAEAEQLLQSAIAQAQEALVDIRRLVHGLRPPALDELGLVGALEQAAHQHQRMAVTVAAPSPLPALPAAVEVAVYRIVQEALVNAAQHGSAAHCTVRLTYDGHLHVTIGDDGAGLPAVVTTGVGLVSMRTRAEELGGTFSIHSPAGGGTEVAVSLPVEPAA